MKIPLVSIIIPAYNRAHVIKETLDSIIDQTYSNWECIVVDDVSDDDTEVILANYILKEKRISYYRRPNSRLKGANSCRNIGFERSKGDFIQWFDSDDLMHKNKLKIKIDTALKHNADVIIDTHSLKNEFDFDDDKEYLTEVFQSSKFYIDFLLGKKSVITNDVMVRKTKLLGYYFDEKLHKAQEYDFFSRVFEQKLVYCFIDKPLSYYRESLDSISKNTSRGKSKQVESLIYLSKKMKDRYKDNKLIIEKARRQGRKTYKRLILRNQILIVLKHLMFFKDSFQLPLVKFLSYIVYNFLFKKGFDKMKQKV